MAIRYTFKDYERLKREQHIDTLFRTGKAFSIYPIKVIYHTVSRGAETSPSRVGFSVPKKKFKRAVHRHRIRRLMIEAWRKHKHLLNEAVASDKQVHIFLIFLDTSIPDLLSLESRIASCIDKLTEETKGK